MADVQPPPAAAPPVVPETGWLVDVERRYRLYLSKEGQPTVAWLVEDDDVSSVAAELRLAADGLEAAAKAGL